MSEFKLVPGEYKTVDGRRAIVRFRVQEPYNTVHPLVGEVEGKDGNWDRSAWMDDGVFSRFSKDNRSDLVPPVRYAYINCYARDAGAVYPSLKEADESTTNYRVGVLEVELDLVGNCKWDCVRFVSRQGCVHA